MIGLRSAWLPLCHMVIAVAAAKGAGPVVAADRLPEFDKVQTVVVNYFAKQKDFRSADLISRKQTAAACDEIAKLGWTVADRPQLEKRTLDDGSLLVTQLRSENGKRFMRQIGSVPMGYDQLDRLSQLPQGRSTLERMMNDPTGVKMLEYFAKTPSGHGMLQKMSRDAAGDFDQPTGKIYTVDALVKALAESHRTATSSLATQAGKR